MYTAKLIRRQEGAATVESAIILILLLMFIFGVIEFGLLVYNKQILTNASREGARAGIVVGLGRTGGNNAECIVESREVADDYCSDFLINLSANQVTPNIASALIDVDSDSIFMKGDQLRVQINYNYSYLLLPALTFGLTPETVTIEEESVMQLE